MTNIKAVLAEANHLASQPRFDLSRLYRKAYLRCPVDLAQCVGDALRAVYLQSDVYRRQDLLPEIEATAVQPMVLMSGQRE